MSEENTSSTPTPEERAQAIAELHGRAKELVAAIEDARSSVLDGKEGQPSIMQQVSDAYDKAKGLSEEIDTFYSNLHDPANDGSKAIIEAIPEAVELIRQAKERSESLESDIKAYQEQLLGKNEGDKDIPGIKQDVEEKVNQLTELYSRVYEKRGDQPSVAQQIKEFIEQLGQKKSEFEAIKKTVEEYEDTLFGKQGDDGKRKDGIKGEVDGYLTTLSELVKTSTATQDRLREKSERMLQDAATASLAEDSIKQKKSFWWQNAIWAVALFIAIGMLVKAPTMDFSKGLGEHVPKTAEEPRPPVVGDTSSTKEHILARPPAVKQTQQEAPAHPWYVLWLMRLPFLGGAIWLGWYAGKQLSQNKRLQQEYAHKENVAKLYYSLKREIEELEKEGDDARLARILKVRVMRVLVNSMGHNPSITLDSKAHNDNGPMQKSYDKAFDSAKGIAEAIAKIKLK